MSGKDVEFWVYSAFIVFVVGLFIFEAIKKRIQKARGTYKEGYYGQDEPLVAAGGFAKSGEVRRSPFCYRG
jgi:hypothetical protein